MITLDKQPTTIHPLYSDTEYKFTDSTTVDRYLVEVKVGGVVKGTYKSYPDLNNTGRFNPSYLLRNIVLAEFTHITAAVTSYDITSYVLVITPVTGGVSGTALTTELKYTYPGIAQSYTNFDIDSYINGKVLNSVTGELELRREDKQSLTMINSSAYTIGDVTLSYIQGGTEVSTVVTTISSSLLPTLIVIDISPSTLNIPLDVDNYKVTLGTSEVFAQIVTSTSLFKPHRFAYINENGVTEYMLFDGVNVDSLKIKRDTYRTGNKVQVYNIDVDNTFSVRSSYITENKSRDIKYLWQSKVVLLDKDYNTNGIQYPVVLKNTKEDVLDYASGLISYTLEFMYEERVFTR